ncbi:MAG: small ribosomal subunit Rsm22 family protein [Acidimicrobiia bacterium]
MNLDLPGPLRDAIATGAEAVSFAELAETVRELRDAYRSERVEETPRVDSPLAALAYATYRMPGTYAAVRMVLDHSAATIPGLQPRSALDVGGGTGAGAWALADRWPDIETVTIQDRSPTVVQLGERLAASRSGGPTFRWQTRVATEQADVAMATYLLGELAESERRRLLGDLMTKADTVVLIEPGTTAGYRRILTARAHMIEAGLSIAAPCPHEESCPLADRDWCHFAARFNRTSMLRRLKEAEHGHDDEKFSYVVGTRLPVAPAANRILRHPRKGGRMVTFQLCDGDGTAHPVTVSKRHGSTYRAARDTRWGDEWPPRPD